jgi:hypothetical protein
MTNEARPVVNISVDPVAGTAKLTRGTLVAGMNHQLRFRNLKGAWLANGDYSLVVKQTASGEPWAFATSFVVDQDDSKTLVADLDLFTQPVMDAINGQDSLTVYWHLIDRTNRESYGPPVQVPLYNTAHRDSDVAPPPALLPAFNISELWRLRITDEGQIMVEERQ